ncbi:cation diffusion facilitator family transporter [Sphingomonas donggukensis]|uniref:Cation diffusion facilitator family transporter n=1 Tax=Sphingomonas donggukensis TaxID=2949093 RepID=A0ABY4TUG7_9SPHN|nr:cation diffusion facilitator family transporter [Sphingomonas donggukensis]URW76049.1 cation diffusion facilitator family transporter [Sphingomonas donggukensis]
MGGNHGHASHHGHDHGHAHAPADFGRAFAIGTALNLGFVVVEAGFGIAADSVALLADAGHNLSDVLGLLIAWGAATLAKRPASARYTYGLKSSSILAALANAVLLLVAVGAILLETLQRLNDPPAVQANVVIWVALVGIAVNTATALLFARGRHGDLNIRGAYLHMAADALVSAGVVVGGLLMLWSGFAWIDPVVSLAIVAVILWSTWGLFRDALGMAMQAVPAAIDPHAVRTALVALPGVERLHDLHIWSMSTTENALTAHLVMPAGHPGDAFLRDLQHRLDHDFGIGHATIQIEVGDGTGCRIHAH